ncbi:MAG: nuclear transport factor 2 family protein [Candidatus Lambdaproteobacteria bacterium]|nr:nuclear transport factor 2 family protein [Candidatus Lambdaproteobacteria bacterium]
MGATTDARDEVRNVLWRLNAAWREGRPEAMTPLLHPDVVIVPPGFTMTVRGREACVASYREFATRAKVHEVRVREPRIEVFGATAIATTGFELAFELEGQRYREAGHDVWVFAREGGAWLGIWRTLVVGPGPGRAA